MTDTTAENPLYTLFGHSAYGVAWITSGVLAVIGLVWLCKRQTALGLRFFGIAGLLVYIGFDLYHVATTPPFLALPVTGEMDKVLVVTPRADALTIVGSLVLLGIVVWWIRRSAAAFVNPEITGRSLLMVASAAALASDAFASLFPIDLPLQHRLLEVRDWLVDVALIAVFVYLFVALVSALFWRAKTARS